MIAYLVTVNFSTWHNRWIQFHTVHIMRFSGFQVLDQINRAKRGPHFQILNTFCYLQKKSKPAELEINVNHKYEIWIENIFRQNKFGCQNRMFMLKCNHIIVRWISTDGS